MSLLVLNCNHWIGFHLIQALLDLEYSIDGVFHEKYDDLTLFFGRNSRFNLVSSVPNKKYRACFLIGEHEEMDHIQAEKAFIVDVNHSADAADMEHLHVVKTPLLYGEWMPMNERGFYLDGEWISFRSDRFKDEAVYIKNFIECLLQFLRVDKLQLPASIQICSKHAIGPAENAVYVRENENKTEKVRDVIKHYEKYQNINKF